MNPVAGNIGLALFIFSFVNFGAFAVSTHILGGDAISGKEENGRYYVAHKGKYTEVSQAAFRYSEIQTVSMWITHLLGMLGIFCYGWSRRKDMARSVHQKIANRADPGV